MFFRTMNLTQFKSNPSDPLNEIEGEKVLQLLHGGHEVKVVMTQEHYFSLLSQIADLKNLLSAAREQDTTSEPHIPYAKMKDGMRERIEQRKENGGYHDNNRVGSRKKAVIRGTA